MHNPNLDQEAEHVIEAVADRWHRARAAYRMANLATHHVLGFAVKTVLLAYFLFIGLFLFLFFLFIRLLPMISIFEVRTLLPEAKIEEEVRG